jgi:integrase
MPRKASGYWDERSSRYYVRLGEIDPKTGRRRAVLLRHPDGSPIARGDDRAVAAAIQRLLARVAEEERRIAGPTVADLVNAFLAWHEEHSKPRTVETHEYHLVRFCRHEWAGVQYQDRPAASITVADLTRYRRAMEARDCQTGYVKLAYASVLACWRWAARPVEGREPPRLLDANPFDGLQRPRKGRGRRLILPWPTIVAFLRFAQDRTRGVHSNGREHDRLRVLALRLMAECGCRPSEAVACRWDWVLEEERVVVIPAGAQKTGHRTQEDRIIGLSPELAAELAALRGTTHPIFVFTPATDPRGADRPPSVHRYNEWFRRLRGDANAAGLALPDEATPYTFRHSLISQARAAGMDLRDLAPAMGHSADVAEKVYSHSQNEEIREKMDRVRRLRGAQSGGEEI